jgi:hypothetical protein
MSIPEPKLPWYQFRLRPLLLFALFVAVLCSIGVYTYWIISLCVLIGIPLGILVARAKEGVVVCGVQFFLIALVGCGCVSATTVGGQWGIEWWWAIGWWLTIVIAVPMGCVYGRLMSDAPKARRRGLQIIPIALLLLMFVEGIDVVWHGARQREIIATITKLGGSIGDGHTRDFIFVDLARTQVTDAALKQLKDLSKLRGLQLGNTQVTDAGLEWLNGLTQLQYVDLRKTEVTDEGVKKLQQALPNCKIEH